MEEAEGAKPDTVDKILDRIDQGLRDALNVGDQRNAGAIVPVDTTRCWKCGSTDCTSPIETCNECYEWLMEGP